MNIHILRRRIENEKLGIIFLQETKCSEDELKIIGEKVWRGNEAIVVDAKGMTREIRILWNPREVFLSDFMAMQLSLLEAFHILGMSTRRILTNIYRPPHGK